MSFLDEGMAFNETFFLLFMAEGPPSMLFLWMEILSQLLFTLVLLQYHSFQNDSTNKHTRLKRQLNQKRTNLVSFHLKYSKI